MMKRLLLVPVLFTALACAPVKEKIEDRGGGCVMGNCGNNGLGKPQACLSTSKISSFKGYTFETTETVDDGLTKKATLQFAASNAALTQKCEKGTDYVSPSLVSDYSENIKGDRLRFLKPDVNEVTIGTKPCKAEILSDNFKVSYEGMCLVLETESGQKLYYERK